MKSGRASCAAVICLALLPGFAARAGDADYALVAGEGHLGFTAVQQGAGFDGEFERFDARLHFDAAALDDAWIEATVETGSVNTRNTERDGYLRTGDWFDVSRWPTAVFRADEIRAAEDAYLASGTLTLRDVTAPVLLRFTFAPQPDGSARLLGEARLNRLDFGVGQGDWRDTQWVGAEVEVHVDIRLQAEGAPADQDQGAGSGQAD